MCSGRSDWALPQPGFPIRRSTDQSLVDSSPWLFAATHVLHRHLAPRHPPLALCSLKIAHSSALRPRLVDSTLRFPYGRVAYVSLGDEEQGVKNTSLNRCSCSLCSSQRPRRDRCRSRGCGTHASGNTETDLGLDRSRTPVLRGSAHPRVHGAASSKQSSEHPTARLPMMPRETPPGIESDRDAE